MDDVFTFIVIAIIIIAIVRSAKAKKPNEKNARPGMNTIPSALDMDNGYQQPSSIDWISAADTLQCTYIRPANTKEYPSLEGFCQNIKFSVSCADMQNGMPRMTYNCVVNDVFGISFILVNSVIATPAGMTPISTQTFCGEKKNFYIYTSDPANFKKLFDEDKIKTLTELMECYNAVTVTNGLITVTIDNSSSPDSDIVENLTDTAAQLSKRIQQKLQYEEYTSQEVKVSANVPKPFKIEKGAADTHASVFTSKPIITKAVLEVKPISPQKTPPQPAAPEEIVKDAVSATQTASVPENVGKDHASMIGAEELAKMLFSNSFPGQAEKEAFERVAGQTVTWHGTLKSAYSFMSDFTLGLSGKGVKATFFIAEITGSYGMKTKINAVAAMPPEAIEQLKPSTGKEFTFTGKLMKFEGFSKEIYLKDAAIVQD